MGVTSPDIQSGVPPPGPGGTPLALPGVTRAAECTVINDSYYANPNLLPGLVPFDLTRGGSMFTFHGLGNIDQYAFYVNDTIRLGEFMADSACAATSTTVWSRKTGFSRGSGCRINREEDRIRCCESPIRGPLETPFNENLLLSSATGAGGLAQNIFGAKAASAGSGHAQPIQCGSPAAAGQIFGVRRRLFLEIHAQCLRLRHAVQHSHHVSHRLAQFQAGRPHRPAEHH